MKCPPHASHSCNNEVQCDDGAQLAASCAAHNARRRNADTCRRAALHARHGKTHDSCTQQHMLLRQVVNQRRLCAMICCSTKQRRTMLLVAAHVRTQLACSCAARIAAMQRARACVQCAMHARAIQNAHVYRTVQAMQQHAAAHACVSCAPLSMLLTLLCALFQNGILLQNCILCNAHDQVFDLQEFKDVSSLFEIGIIICIEILSIMSFRIRI